VRDEICKIAAFWLALGADGYRMDAVPFLLELDGITDHMEGDPKGWLRSLRSFVCRRKGEALLLGEVNTAMKELSSYFGGADGDALHMEFAFLLNQSLWLALARGEAEPLEQVISTLPVVPHDNAWATFLRNHDELTLDKLTVSQREEVFAAFGPKPDMQMYGHGLRRRTATMLGGDGPRLRMAWSLMLSLPGTPVMFMGDEIGMGEQLAIPDRYAVRVPMHWSADRNGGFSTAPAAQLVRPLPRGAFAPAKVNVEDQRRDPDSLLRFVRHLIRARRETPELGWGTSTLLETEDPALFAHRCDWEDNAVIAIHNLGARPATAELALGDGARGVHDLLGDFEEPAARGGRLAVTLEGYGGRWLRVMR
jgi:glycosidase